MASYKKMYFKLFNKVTDAITILQDAQRLTEEMYIEDEDPTIIEFDGKSSLSTNEDENV